MDIKHLGNWPEVGILRLFSPALQASVRECPICFALTADPMDHAEYHQRTDTDKVWRQTR